jgi:hypothetical protein
MTIGRYARNVTVGIQRQLTPTSAVDVSYLGSWIVGADSSTVLNVPAPGAGRLTAAPRARTEQRDGHSLGRLLGVPCADRARGAAPVARPGVWRQLHPVEGDRRCVRPWRHHVRNESAAGCPEHGRRTCGLQLRPSASIRRQRHVCAAGSCTGYRMARLARIGLASQRDRDVPIRRAVHREPRDRSREYRIRAGAAAGRHLRRQSECSAYRGAVVQHRLLCAARPLLVRQRGT